MKINLLILVLGLLLIAIISASAPVFAQTAPAPAVRIVLPERFRVLKDQYFDLRVEAENIGAKARVSIIIETVITIRPTSSSKWRGR